MALRFRAAYNISDYNAETSESGFTVVDVSSVAALDTFVIAQEPVYAGLTDGPIISAMAYAKRSPGVVKGVTGTAPIGRRLLILLTDGVRYGSFVVPAPRADLDYETDGPYAGIRIATGPNPTAALLDQLMVALAPTLLPDGSPFPVGQWQAALISNP